MGSSFTNDFAMVEETSERPIGDRVIERDSYHDREKSQFSKFDFKAKFTGDSDWNISEWLEIFEIHCTKYSMYENEKLL